MNGGGVTAPSHAGVLAVTPQNVDSIGKGQNDHPGRKTSKHRIVRTMLAHLRKQRSERKARRKQNHNHLSFRNWPMIDFCNSCECSNIYINLNNNSHENKFVLSVFAEAGRWKGSEGGRRAVDR